MSVRVGLLLPTVLASKKYGTDRIFAPMYPAVDLANGLVEKGHEVFFYTAGDIKTKAMVVYGDERLIDSNPTYFQFRFREEAERKYATTEIIKRDYEYFLTLKAYQDALAGKLDIIHSYHDFGAHYFNELTKFPTVYTLHDPLPQTEDTIEYLRFDKFKHHNYVSISNSQRNGIVKLNFIDTVYHGLQLEDYEFNPSPQDHFIYFGRLIEDKGADLAIQTSKELGIPIKIATAKSSSNTDLKFFEEKIKPQIDNKNVISAGFLSGVEKSDFIGSAKAYILPLRWKEPFGLTIIEAMACGTPVVAFGKGSVPELVKDGITGFVVKPDEGVEGLKKALAKIDQIERKSCRRWVEEKFSVKKMVENYENVYNRVINQ